MENGIYAKFNTAKGAILVKLTHDLTPGTVVILDKMIPHHFSTDEEGLIVLPIHIFSSTSLENNHPMFAGTHKV